jgi:hypothetical protein
MNDQQEYDKYIQVNREREGLQKALEQQEKDLQMVCKKLYMIDVPLSLN